MIIIYISFSVVNTFCDFLITFFHFSCFIL
nr:MAG TPA: hypothetical protein [Caudoviricetes sp.]